jgi:hypothetical protein
MSVDEMSVDKMQANIQKNFKIEKNTWLYNFIYGAYVPQKKMA